MAVINNFPNSNFTGNSSNFHNGTVIGPGAIGPSGHPGTPGIPEIPLDPFDAYTADLELAADLLAAGSITGPDYFRVKHMIKSSDPDVKALGRTFLHEKSKL